jgi:cyclic-di-AMP phosphodiesterase PgpH
VQKKLNPSDTISVGERVPQWSQKLREVRAKVQLFVRFLAGTFEGRATTEFLADESLQRRKKIAHFVYYSLLAGSVSWLLTSTDYDTEAWVNLKPGDVVEEEIVSPLTAQVEPKETTKSYRENLARRIPPVFDYDDQSTERWLKRWKQAFRKVREEYYQDAKASKDSGILEQIDKRIQEITGVHVQRRHLQFMHQNRFSSPVEKTFIKLGEYLVGRIIAPTDLFDSYYSTGIMVRQVNQSMNETLIQDVSHIWSLETAREYLYQIASKIPEREISAGRAMAEIVGSAAIPNLKPNEILTKKRVSIVLSNLKDPIQSVQKGKAIVGRGERLSDSQWELLQDLQYLTSPTSNAKRFLFTFAVLLLLFSIIFRINMTGKGFWNLTLKDAVFFWVITIVTLASTKYSYPYLVQFAKFFNLNASAEYLIPVSTGGILIHLMMGKDAGYTYGLVSSLIVGYMLDQSYLFTLWAFLVNSAAIQSLRSCKQRTDLFKAGAWSGLVGALLVLIFSFIDLMGYKRLDWTMMLAEPVIAFLSGLLASIITSVLVPFLESAFGYTTSLKLLELSNFNHPLLHTLMMKAPGTYHHSVIVGSLAEVAADKVNANGLLARVSAYYHDIGKMSKPLYFIENQSPGNNPHDHLAPNLSAKILFSHVKNGARLGRDYNLGKTIVDIIEQHHGTTLVSYFFNKAKKQEDHHACEVEESHFRYPGPKPKTREAGIVMLADACEAATRSIADPTPAKIQAMVHSIITKRFLEEQFSDCDLTLRDMQIIEENFTRTLVSLYHHRIEYPGQRSTLAGAVASDAADKKRSQQG